VVKSQGTETLFRKLPIVDGTSRLARYDFLLVFYSDVTRGIHGFWNIQRRSLNVLKHDFGHFPSFEEHADGTDELGSCDLL